MTKLRARKAPRGHRVKRSVVVVEPANQSAAVNSAQFARPLRQPAFLSAGSSKGIEMTKGPTPYFACRVRNNSLSTSGSPRSAVSPALPFIRVHSVYPTPRRITDAKAKLAGPEEATTRSSAQVPLAAEGGAIGLPVLP